MGGGGGRDRWVGGGRRIEVFVKIQKKNLGAGEGSGWGGGVDVIEEFLGKFTKKKYFFGGGVGSGGGGRVGGVRVDVNEELKIL